MWIVRYPRAYLLSTAFHGRFEMDLKTAFLEFHEVIGKAPKRCPADQVAFWALLGAKYTILAVAISETNSMCDAAADTIVSLEKKIAHLEDENGALLKDLEAATSRGT